MTDIGWTGLALSLLLVAIALVLSVWRRTGLELSIAWAATEKSLPPKPSADNRA